MDDIIIVCPKAYILLSIIFSNHVRTRDKKSNVFITVQYNVSIMYSIIVGLISLSAC